jgi:hypothetical protein
MMDRQSVIALLLSTGLLLLVIELVRRRSLREQYALLWLLTSLVLIGLSLWRGALELLARLLAIAYPPTALMVTSVGCILLILLHFSLVISKLSDENKELAQRTALLAWQLQALEKRLQTYQFLDQI